MLCCLCVAFVYFHFAFSIAQHSPTNFVSLIFWYLCARCIRRRKETAVLMSFSTLSPFFVYPIQLRSYSICGMHSFIALSDWKNPTRIHTHTHMNRLWSMVFKSFFPYKFYVHFNSAVWCINIVIIVYFFFCCCRIWFEGRAIDSFYSIWLLYTWTAVYVVVVVVTAVLARPSHFLIVNDEINSNSNAV